MIIINKTLSLKTGDDLSFCNLTPQIKKFVEDSHIRNGQVLIFTKHTTAGLRVNEDEKRLFEDIHLFLEKIAPKNAKYLHDDIHLRDCPPDERLNGHAHLKSLILNTSEIIPVIDGKLVLGEWQNLFFIELDGSRKREVIVQIKGE